VSGLPRRRLLGLLGGGIAAGAFVRPAGADAALDVRILQTASSLEALAEAAWVRVPGDALAGFGTDAGRRHTEQKQAFQAQTTALGGRAQDAPNPTFASLLAGADAIMTATTIEKVLVDTYLSNLAVLQDRRAKELVAAAMAVSAQHLAFLRTAGALLAGGTPHLVKVPFPRADLAKLPPTAGTVATPDARHRVSGPELIADPASGALG
jgi:hypothetical protein